MKKLVWIIGVLLGVGFIAFGIIWQTQFFLTSTVPKNGDGKANTGTIIKFKFNKNLSEESLSSFSLSPRVPGKLRVDGNQLIFEPETTYVLNTAYTARLAKPVSADGKTGKEAVINFTARYVPFAEIPAEQQDQQIGASDSLESEFPIVRFIPHETAEYKIEYEIKGQELVLKISLYAILNRPSQLKQYNQQLKEYKKAALDYVRASGEDPAKYKIEYSPPEAKDF